MAISFKPYYKNGNPIGSGTYKFREYSVEKLPRSFISLEVKKLRVIHRTALTPLKMSRLFC